MLRLSAGAILQFLAAAAAMVVMSSDAFVVPTTTTRRPVVVVVAVSQKTHLNSSRFLGMDEDEDDEEDEDDDDDEDDDETSLYSSAKSPFSGMSLDPNDPNPLIKPRPSRFFPATDSDDGTPTIPDDQLVQTMTDDQRKENLVVMRQIQTKDLPDLRRRKDHAGWVEANNDLKRRYAKDPWFGVNERLRSAMQLGDDDSKVQQLIALADKLGGAPEGITHAQPYAVHTEIYDIGLSPSRVASLMEREIRLERAARGRAMMAERKKNLEAQQRQYEEDMRNPGLREDREAKERRERTMRRLLDELDADNQKKTQRAKELLGKIPETPSSRTEAMQRALKEAQEDVRKMRREQELGGGGKKGLSGAAAAGKSDDDAPTASAKSGADKAREALANESGRPRLPGDADVTRGELDQEPSDIQSSSTTTTDSVTVEVSSVYNKDQSDPPMRKHCFQYTIRITNKSSDSTIQLLGRKFEIQTVGSSMKDIVQGEGVTGRTPILKPGEVFEYTSTAPLSVRPIGTTIIAARMRGEYRYVTLQAGQDTASSEQLAAGGEAVAELGTFHFIFPEDQRVKPFRYAETDDEDEEEEEDDDDTPSPAAASTATPAASAPSPARPSTPAAAPGATLPGDPDMQSGIIGVSLNDSSEAVTDAVRVHVTSSYRPERSDASLDKHCFAYNIRITNESNNAVQLVSRRFEIQTIGSANKDIVQGPGVTGRQPILKPGESFEYTSTAPLSVKPMLEKTPVVARMQGEYSFVQLADDASTPLSSTPMKAKLSMFHFILPALV